LDKKWNLAFTTDGALSRVGPVVLLAARPGTGKMDQGHGQDETQRFLQPLVGDLDDMDDSLQSAMGVCYAVVVINDQLDSGLGPELQAGPMWVGCGPLNSSGLRLGRKKITVDLDAASTCAGQCEPSVPAGFEMGSGSVPAIKKEKKKKIKKVLKKNPMVWTAATLLVNSVGASARRSHALVKGLRQDLEGPLFAPCLIGCPTCPI